MKKFTLAATAFGMLIALNASAQAPRFVLFEHFTQASCGPCAAQNPGFQSTVLNPNPTTVRHIAYHTSWPGVDPMYNFNPTEPTDRVNYYGVTGVPHVEMNGNQKTGQPGAFTQADVDNQFAMGSPIKISVTEVDNGNNRDVTVTVLTVGTVPSGTWKMRVAIVEDPIIYGTPPGSNGETDFPNVLRKMLPNTTGDAYTAASIGNSVTFNYNYVEDGSWVNANMKAIAFVQNDVTQEVLQTGTVNDPIINYTLGQPSVQVMAGTNGNASSFSMTSMNTGNATETFNYTLTTDLGAGWTANFTVNSTPYTTTASVSTNAGATNNISINVTPSTTPYVGRATLTVTSVTNPSSPAMSYSVYVIANVTDLIVNNSGGIGDGVTLGNAANWDSCYVNGLAYANEPGTAKTSEVIAVRAMQDNAFTGVNNVYYNVGWTFPGLYDNLVNQLAAFLNTGGCLFLSGQDIAWEQFDVTTPSPYYTVTCQNFMNNYLGAGFSNDGTTANTQLTAITTDPIFGTVATSTISNFYGGTYFFPDQITVSGTGTPIFRYNNLASKIAGMRNTNNTWKTVYIGTGIEMLATPQIKYDILKWSHDWFYGLTSTQQFDQQMMSLGNNYPNPAGEINFIPVSNLEKNVTLEILDLQGRLVKTQQVTKGTTVIEVSTTSLDAGMYMYRLNDGQNIIGVQRMQVIR
ncbi:MAG: hypothetical protein FD123_674 [Bacteroidetes bacterium]|nr:MAG: hypothetical protein FD123_674 [Bacteroidota bacterium]